ncbi:MAG: aspartate-semialdehyde dehydrogenase [Desulfovibrionaceae bacterium]|nr:aspartate-semialdehyde dehydrogenase [Desulfovibrionaceae bacterium]
MSKALRLAVVGATGAIGTELLKIIDERDFPQTVFVPLASSEKRGATVEFQGEDLDVLNLETFDFSQVDLAFFATPKAISELYAPKAVKQGCLVIDASSAFRLKEDCPLCVANLNEEALSMHRGLIAQPEAVSMALALVLAPLKEAVGLERVGVTALMSVSALGLNGVRELEQQIGDLLNMREMSKGVFKEQIAFNILPYVGNFKDNDSTSLENELPSEVLKILEAEDFKLAFTCLQIPLFYGHGLSVNLETLEPLTAKQARAILVQSQGVKVLDNPMAQAYPQPFEAIGCDQILVGRIREDSTQKRGLNLWMSFDNVHTAAALNMVKIAEILVRDNLIAKLQ